jgi:hypothetical protein
MQSCTYFRHQADTCLRLSASCTDQNLANHFQAMAQDFMAKAAAAEVRDKSDHSRLPRAPKREGLADPN